MTINRIFLDLDGILVDAVSGFCKVHNKDDPYLDPANWGKHNIDEIWHMTKKEFWRPCNKTFWENLPPMSDANQIYEIVMEFAEENNIVVAVLTKSGLGDGCLQGKKNWVDKHFPKLSKNFWVGFGTKAIAANPHSILIDDYNKNCDEFVAAQGNCILYPRMWNRNYNLDAVSSMYLYDALDSIVGEK